MNISHEKRQQVRRSKGFRWTNDVWNELNLNAGWSIGLITKIVDDKQFESFKEWESYYFETGQIRQERLKRAIPTTRVRLIDLRAVYKDPQTFKKGLTNYEVDINEAHGRTMDELKGLARVMHEEIIKRGNPYDLSEEDCFTHVYIRVLDESYIGIQREVNTTKTLEKAYPELLFKPTPARKDKYYAVDVEVVDLTGKLLCGIQIKSPYFKNGKTNAMLNAKDYNLKKHGNYYRTFDVPAFFVQSTVEGEIVNKEIFQILNQLSNVKSLQTV